MLDKIVVALIVGSIAFVSGFAIGDAPKEFYKNKYDELYGRYTDLKQDYSELYSKYQALYHDYNTLVDKYNTLVKNYNTLKSECLHINSKGMQQIQ